MTLGPVFRDVLEAARAGAPWGWTTLYREMAPAITGYLRAHGAREPEDLTSEVFVAIVRRLRDFEGDEAGFRSWVFVIAHRRLLDERRRNFRHPVDLVPEYVIDTPVEGADEEAMGNLSVEQIQELFSQLTEDQRDVLLLRIVAGLTVEEVSEVVGKRPGAVKALQRRGLAALARMISKEAVPP